MSDQDQSYRDILRSSYLVGGAQAINYAVGFFRIKLVAMLLGPTGVGLVSLYQSAMAMLGTVSSLGIGTSAVREVALSVNANDSVAMGRTLVILRRACWITGLFGWGLAVTFAQQLSRWMSASSEHAVAISVLGVTLLFAALGGGQTAVLQGMRRIEAIARGNVAAMCINTGVAVALYAWLGRRGIVPVLLATGAVSLGVSWWFARKAPIETVPVPWREFVSAVRRLAGLGLVFMWSGILTAGLDMVTRSLVTRELGLEAAGLYQAAWAISGLFANFVLSAMGTDFYPRLTTVIEDRQLACRAVNQQTEIGVLLALPGLLGTLAFAPWIMQALYTTEFMPAASLLPWFVIGVFGRVVSWPLGYVQLAKGTARWFFGTETVFCSLHLGLLLAAVPRFGLAGVAYVFALVYVLYTMAMLLVTYRLIGFRWSASLRKLLLLALGLTAAGVAASLKLSRWEAVVVGTALFIVGGSVGIRGIVARSGTQGRLYKLVHAIDFARWR